MLAVTTSSDLSLVGLNEPARRRGKGSGLRAAALTGAFAAALLVSPVLGGAVFGPAPVLAAFLIAGLSVFYGQAIRRLLQVPADASYAAGTELVAGFAGVSLVHLTATTVLNLSAAAVLPIDLLGGAALALGAGWMTELDPGDDTETGGRRSARLDAAVPFACALLVSFWARKTVSAVPHAQATGVFPAWVDFVLHASEITYLRDYPAFGRQSPFLSGFPSPLYHRASYAMPALFSTVGGVPSLEAATTFWLPTGLLLCALATYAFGAALGGRLAGVGALAMVFLFPDASAYGFQNHFLSFHWLMQVAGGSGYAIALILIALIVIVTGVPGRRLRSLLLALALAMTAGAFRMHVAIVGAGMVGILCVREWAPIKSFRRALGFVALLVASAAILAGMESVSLAPHFLTGLSHPVAFFDYVQQYDAGFSKWLGLRAAARGDIWKVAVGYAMFLAAAYGALIPLTAIGWLTGALGQRVSLIPAALLVAHLAVILLVPTPAHGDYTDFGHRPFVLIYVIFGGLVGAVIGRLSTVWSVRRYGSERPASALLMAWLVLGCSVPWIQGVDVQRRWGTSAFWSIEIGTEAFEAGRFVRTHSTPGELVLTSSEDPLAVYVALTERSAFLSRGDLFQTLGSDGAALAKSRAVAHAALARGATFEELQAFGQSNGVSWYIADTKASQQWLAAAKDRCSYCGRTVQVFDLRDVR